MVEEVGERMHWTEEGTWTITGVGFVLPPESGALVELEKLRAFRDMVLGALQESMDNCDIGEWDDVMFLLLEDLDEWNENK